LAHIFRKRRGKDREFVPTVAGTRKGGGGLGADRVGREALALISLGKNSHDNLAAFAERLSGLPCTRTGARLRHLQREKEKAGYCFYRPHWGREEDVTMGPCPRGSRILLSEAKRRKENASVMSVRRRKVAKKSLHCHMDSATLSAAGKKRGGKYRRKCRPSEARRIRQLVHQK